MCSPRGDGLLIASWKTTTGMVLTAIQVSYFCVEVHGFVLGLFVSTPVYSSAIQNCRIDERIF